MDSHVVGRNIDVVNGRKLLTLFWNYSDDRKTELCF